jgi:hypothetical protein
MCDGKAVPALNNTPVELLIYTFKSFVCVWWCPVRIALCVYFVFIRLLCPMLPVSLDCSFVIAPWNTFADENVLCKIMDTNFTGVVEYFSEPSD